MKTNYRILSRKEMRKIAGAYGGGCGSDCTHASAHCGGDCTVCVDKPTGHGKECRMQTNVGGELSYQ